MNEFSGAGKLLVAFGIVLIIGGALLWLGGKIPGLGRLPGDFVFKKGNFTFYFPLATSILLSVVLSLILSWFGRR